MASLDVTNIKVLRPFEVADLISFYQSDNVMPKGEAEEISKAASMAKFLWNNRRHFRRTSQHRTSSYFKMREDTIFRPVAPFNVLNQEEADEYLREENLHPPVDAYGKPRQATLFTVAEDSSKSERSRKVTVCITSRVGMARSFKLRLPFNEFSLELVKSRLSAANVETLNLFLKSGGNEKEKIQINTEEAFQRYLEKAHRTKQPLELVMDRRRSKKRPRRSGYDDPAPRKRVKQENPYSSTGGLMEAGRKKRAARQKQSSSSSNVSVSTVNSAVPSSVQQEKRSEKVQQPVVETKETETGDDICRICGSYWVKNRWHLDTDWLCCDYCGGWFHVYCVGMEKSEFQRIVDNKEKFKCPQCVQKTSEPKPAEAAEPNDWVYF